MNIHFKNQTLFERLKQVTLAQVNVGSALYGLQDAQSDTDVLCIYFPFQNQTFSFTQTHHQLQFKDTAAHTDYLFVDVFSFIRNALSGDSTLNFEALHSESLLQTPLHFLHSSRYYFYNYPITKAYLGYANRDLKQYWQQPTERDAVKKYMHAERGYLFAQQVIAGDLRLNEPVLLQKKILFSTLSPADRTEVIRQLHDEIDSFRKNTVNPAFEAKQLTRYMQPKQQKLVDQELFKLQQTTQYQISRKEKIDLELFYEVNENGILYD